MQQRRKKEVVLLFVLSASMLACVSGPRISIDTTGMGKSEVSRVLINTLWGSEEKIKGELTRLVNSGDMNKNDPQDFLKSLGFRCENEMVNVCTYHGEIKGRLITQNDTTLPENNRIESMDVAVQIDKKPFIVNFKQQSKINSKLN